MPSVNFFNTKHKTEPPRNDKEFKVHDPGNNLPAITTPADSELYQAIVHNPRQLLLEFIPIDHNITFQDSNGNKISTCDGLLHTLENNEYIAFVELKDEMSGWITDAKDQLGNTIDLFRRNHVYTDYTRRYAYAASREHPQFAFSRKQMMQEFKNTYGFSLRIQNEINV